MILDDDFIRLRWFQPFGLNDLGVEADVWFEVVFSNNIFHVGEDGRLVRVPVVPVVLEVRR